MVIQILLRMMDESKLGHFYKKILNSKILHLKSVKEAEDTEEVQPIEPADKEEIVPSPEEETEEEMKEVPWSAKRFEEMGIRSISQKEIDEYRI